MSHKHAEVLRAIADGELLTEFEGTCGHGWDTVLNLDWFWEPDIWEIRRKPQYIMVNGFKVPKPLDVIKDGDDYFIPNIQRYELYGELAAYTRTTTELHICRGICHATKEAAIAHAKAMLGIDPEE